MNRILSNFHQNAVQMSPAQIKSSNFETKSIKRSLIFRNTQANLNFVQKID